MPRTEKRATAATNIVDKHDLERRKEQEKCIRAISGGKEAIDEKWGGGGGEEITNGKEVQVQHTEKFC